MTHTNPLLLTDEALEDCIDGCSSLELLREILRQPPVVYRDNKIDVKQFAGYFQIALEDLTEDEEANENNYQWGLSIAENINAATFQKPAHVVNPQDAWPKPKRPEK